MRNLIILIIGFFASVMYSQTSGYDRLWATYYGGESTIVSDNAIDSQGNVYIVGYMKGESAYLNPYVSSNVFQSTFGGGETDGYIAKFSPDGLLIWSTFFGGQQNDRVNTIAVNSDGRIFVAGQTSSQGLSTTGVFQSNIAGLQDGFLAEFDSQGTRLWCTYFGGIYDDSLKGMTCDNMGNLFLFGVSSSPSNISTPNGFQAEFVPTPGVTPETDTKNFIVGFSESGVQTWGTYYGSETGNSKSIITGISTSLAGVYVTGFVLDTEMNTYFATIGCHQNYNSNAAGLGVDMFLTQFSSGGSRNWSTYYGGTSTEKSHLGTSLFPNFRNVVATRDFVYISGITGSNNNMSTPGVFQSSKLGQSNFVAKFNDLGVRQWGTYLGNTSANGGTSGQSGLYSILSLDYNEDIMVSGSTPLIDVATDNGYQTTIPLNSFGLTEGGDSFMTKISKDGSSKLYGTYYGGDKPDGGCATLSAGSDFYMVGNTQSTNNVATTNSYQNNLNVNPASTLAELPTNAFIAKFSPIPLKTKDFASSENIMYPVPNSGDFNINLNANYLNSEINIYDISGKKVYSNFVKSISQSVKVGYLSSGTYILKISNNNGLRYERKFLVR